MQNDLIERLEAHHNRVNDPVVVRTWAYTADDLLVEAIAALRAGAGDIDAIKRAVDFRLNEYLCEMKPDFDDSITGFNEAWKVIDAVFATRSALSQPAQSGPTHSDDEAVNRFAAAMKAKLAKKRMEGRGGWETCDPAYLSELLRGHVEKGDPIDVGNLAMMIHQLGVGIARQPAQSRNDVIEDRPGHPIPIHQADTMGVDEPPRKRQL